MKAAKFSESTVETAALEWLAGSKSVRGHSFVPRFSTASRENLLGLEGPAFFSTPCGAGNRETNTEGVTPER